MLQKNGAITPHQLHKRELRKKIRENQSKYYNTH